MNKLIVPWEKSVVLGCLFLLVTAMAVGAYVGIKEEGRAFSPVYQEQKTAGPMVNRAVGAAMEKYLDSADSSVSRIFHIMGMAAGVFVFSDCRGETC